MLEYLFEINCPGVAAGRTIYFKILASNSMDIGCDVVM
jgi:hypothetical protein